MFKVYTPFFMSKSVAITFIICTYNRADYLDDTLSSLTGAEPPISPVEILVVDNNSEDHTPGVADRYKKMDLPAIVVRRVQEENQGLSFARNRGIKEASAPVIVFVDDDVRVEKYYINAWLQFFRDYQGVQAAGGKIHVQFDDPRPGWMSRFLLPLLGHHDHGNSVKLYRRPDYPFGGNMAFRKDLFNQFDPFDTELGRIGKELKASEEKELFQRLKKYGVEVHYVPKAKLFHRVNASRLTTEYIRRQALGLGQSLALQLKNQPTSRKISHVMKETGKWITTCGLFILYLISLQPSKGIFLFRFRKWIARGYGSAKHINTGSNV